ncbi:MAG: hypothetical protein M1840_005534 [Geoglossum simile]|nr:MAG: hypothetical protein M1840_005534 [Geoglossum simile]
MSDQDPELGRFEDRRARRLSFRRANTTPTQPPLELADHSALADDELHRGKLVLLIVGDDQPIKHSLRDAANWYTSFLESNFRHHWRLLRSTLHGLDDESTQPKSGDLGIIYGFIIMVARLLKAKENIALVDIVDELDNNGLLKQQLDEERAIPNQIVFAALGWLTMLYQAVPQPEANELKVTKLSTNCFGIRTELATRKYRTYRQGFDFIDQPLHSLLGSYGDLIPRMHQVHSNDPGVALPSDNYIEAQSVCFSILQDLADLKIEWVTSLALHLELDSGRKTLKLFQFPSFCRLMHVERRNNMLSRLFNDHAARSSEDVRIPDVPTDKFFKETLLSYRLIFGQDDRSWRAFSQLARSQETYRGQTFWEATWDCDPMLLTLCGKSATSGEAKQIYDDINAGYPASYYDPNTEFPFFGKRLLELQQFIKRQKPQDLRALLRDRRDVSVWYGVWSNQVSN